jgi:threonine/homoserine/homoserine lactone efflux protein
MLEYLFIGSGFAFAAAIQPGPLQAYFLSSVAQRGWRRTLPASFAPMISDGPIALLVLLVINHITETMIGVLQAAGGIFLIYLAWASYKQWKNQTITRPETNGSVPRTLLQAAIVNILNPNPYLGWSLVLGPAVLEAWHQNPTNAIVLIVSFYATMVGAQAGIILLFGTTHFLGSNGRRILIFVSAVMLLALGIYLLAASLIRY